MKTLARLTYISRAAQPDSRGPMLEAIAREFALRNAQREITGVLVATKGAYAQLLEGPRAALSELICRIGQDERHCAFTLVEFRPAAARVVPSWSMSLVKLRPRYGEPAPDFDALVKRSPDEILRFLAAQVAQPAR